MGERDMPTLIVLHNQSTNPIVKLIIQIVATNRSYPSIEHLKHS